MNNLRTSPLKFLQKPSPLFFMVHLLHPLYGVDAPACHRHKRKLVFNTVLKRSKLATLRKHPALIHY